MQNINHNLKRIRQLKRIKHGDISKVTGLSKSQISRIERGQQTVSMEQYEGIARAIGCDVDDILPDDLRDQLKQKNTCELPVLEMLPHSGPATWTRKLCLPVTENLWRENRYYFRAFSEYLGPHIMARDLLLCEWRPVKFHEAREGSIYTPARRWILYRTTEDP
jgi:transcriptional regulator with XRE-family HTH domain